MNSKYVDFIGMYENVFPDGYCTHMINEFERLFNKGYCSNRQDEEGERKTRKQDYFYFLNIRNHSFSSFNNESPNEIFFEGLQKCFDDYVNEFDILKEFDIKCTTLKMQRTDPGGGYHIWHSEQGPNADASRCLVFSAYLNDIDQAGETEFLYQRIRIPPKENTMVIWPAAFTHTHRGNVVHGTKPKYIITGWFYLE